MPDLDFIKLKTYMFDDEKIRIIESMPDADSLIVIWVKLLCQAGKTYAGGYICLNENVPYTDEELAAVLSRPINTVRLAIETFKKLGMIEINHDGILLLNFAKHQNIEAMERIREGNRIRQQRLREKTTFLLPEGDVTRESRVSNADVTQQNKNKNKNKNKKGKDKDNNSSSFNKNNQRTNSKNAGVNRINSDDPDKYIKGKYGHMVRR